MKRTEYRIAYTYSSREDIRKIRNYILDNFKYLEYANNFINKLKAATKELKILPTEFNTIEFQYRGYDIIPYIFDFLCCR